MSFIVMLITIIYTLIIALLIIGCYRQAFFRPGSANFQTRFSIIIPFRNEASNLEVLLSSIEQVDYKRHLFELILVDDQSSDDSEAIIYNYLKNSTIDYMVIQNKPTGRSPKKEAIDAAIKKSKYEWILTTDADCRVPKDWLKILDAFIQETQAKMIVAPVSFNNPKSVLDGFQLMDFLSLQAATIGGFGLNNPFLCNGANLAYTKEFYHELNGFIDNFKIASGDDIFLLEKAVKYDQNRVHYLKSPAAAVTTSPESNLGDLIQQRLRWASKTTAYTNYFGKLLAFVVALMNAMLIISLVLVFLDQQMINLFISVFSVKVMIDFWLISISAQLFGQKRFLYYYPISSFCYPLFAVFIGIYSVFSNYKWKGRSFSK